MPRYRLIFMRYFEPFAYRMKKIRLGLVQLCTRIPAAADKRQLQE